MFKVLVLQALYNLSDDQAEFQIRDRLSFLRFLGLTPNVPSPDAKTIWDFKQRIEEQGREGSRRLFEAFNAVLGAAAQPTPERGVASEDEESAL